jgi:hypothetical protein
VKLHPSVIEKLIKIYESNGGFQDFTRLRAALAKLDLTPYERKQNGQDTILVTTDDYVKELSKKS